MKRKCVLCGMIRSTKDLVLQDNGKYICFSCWNKNLKENGEKDSQEHIK